MRLPTCPCGSRSRTPEGLEAKEGPALHRCGLLARHELLHRFGTRDPQVLGTAADRRIKVADLLAYKQQDEAERRVVLDELTAEAEKHGLEY